MTHFAHFNVHAEAKATVEHKARFVTDSVLCQERTEAKEGVHHQVRSIVNGGLQHLRDMN